MGRKGSLKNRRAEVSPGDRPPLPVKRAPAYFTVLLLLVGVSAYLLVQLSHLNYWKQNREVFFFGQNLPLMTTEDAYYYLRLARELTNGQYHPLDEKRPGFPRPYPVPLIVSLTSFLHGTTGVPIERIAFYLPPVLGSLLVLVVFLWGMALGGRIVALTASLTVVAGVYWCTRTGLGRFDTDCLNPVFAYLIPFLMYRFVSVQTSRRFLYLAGSLLSLVLFSLWWVPGFRLGSLLIIGTYSVSFFLPSSRAERLFKLGLLLLIAVTCLGFALIVAGVLPRSLSPYFGPEFEYLGLMNTHATSQFPNVGESISELQSRSLRVLALASSGNEIPFVVSLVGLISLFMKRKEMLCFLGPGLLFGLGSLLSERFIIFFIPACAIGMGYLVGEVLFNSSYGRKISSPLLKWGICGAMVVSLLYPGFYWSTVTQPKPRQTAHDAELARVIAEKSGPHALVWAWWDSGYFLQYFTGRGTIVDGGSQTPDRTFIAAYPLACDNAGVAGYWMRFFSAHMGRDMDVLTSRFGDLSQAIPFLVEVFENPADLHQILGKYRLSDPPFWQQFLFPEVDTLLFVSYNTLDKTHWWYYFGTWDFDRKEGTRPNFRRSRSMNLPALERDGLFAADGSVFKVGKVISVGPSASGFGGIKQTDFRIHDRTGAGPLLAEPPNLSIDYEPESVAVINKKTSTAYYLSGEVFQSLAWRLLLQNQGRDMEHFIPVGTIVTVGGAWKIN